MHFGIFINTYKNNLYFPQIHENILQKAVFWFGAYLNWSDWPN